jgi:SPP1 gp7 family putative phage head morphogenesis protein
LLEAYEAMWKDGYETAKRQLDNAGIYVSTDARFINQRAADWAEVNVGKLIRGIDERTRNGVASLTAQARDAGWSNDRLAEEISRAYSFSDERAELIAVTETARADVEANLAAYRDEGIAYKEWVLEADACESCRSNDVGPIPISSLFPSGVDGPPDHPNCRCDVVPAWLD